MNSSHRLTIAALALLSGVSVAAAASDNTMKSPQATNKDHMTQSALPKSSADKTAMTKTSSVKSDKAGSSSGLPMATDKIVLTSKQRREAWHDISILAAKEKVPSGFTAKVGASVPNGLTTYPVPVTTATKVPKLRPFHYAMLGNNKILIVNPNDKKIAEIIVR
jgi:hypothetical protein